MSDGYAFGSLDELGEGPGFRKVRRALGVTAFGVNGVVYAPGFEGFLHYHDEQEALYPFTRSAPGSFSGTRASRPSGSSASTRTRGLSL
jgi:hypothetical protein